MLSKSSYEMYVMLGGKLSQFDFNENANLAIAYLDTITFGRVKKVIDGPAREDERDKVLMAICALVDEINAQKSGGELASATNDGYTETYVTTGKSAEDRLRAIATRFLASTGLLYRGGGSGVCLY